MAACQALYYDTRDLGRTLRGSDGQPLGRSDGWKPCPAQASRHLEVDGHLRHICPEHQRQIAALAAAGLTGRLRWAWPQQPA